MLQHTCKRASVGWPRVGCWCRYPAAPSGWPHNWTPAPSLQQQQQGSKHYTHLSLLYNNRVQNITHICPFPTTPTTGFKTLHTSAPSLQHQQQGSKHYTHLPLPYNINNRVQNISHICPFPTTPTTGFKTLHTSAPSLQHKQQGSKHYTHI